eukprot:15468830-Alexandrium_andersonii.AAC.1
MLPPPFEFECAGGCGTIHRAPTSHEGMGDGPSGGATHAAGRSAQARRNACDAGWHSSIARVSSRAPECRVLVCSVRYTPFSVGRRGPNRGPLEE